MSADELREMIGYLRRNYRVLDAADFLESARTGTLTESDTCLTFDDSLRCQYDVAAPVLREEGLTAFYFVYSSAFTDTPDILEVYRYFRSTEYPDFDAFCNEFMDQAQLSHGSIVAKALRGFDPDCYLREFPFYSTNDRLFRYVRDRVLTSEQYESVMSGLMSSRGFDVGQALPLLFMSSDHLLALQDAGNVIGLHSHSHPLDMEALSVDEQRVEYASNHAFLESVLFQAPLSMSHPMGRYNSDTLQILSDLGVLIGFRSSLSIRHAPSLLEIPREDHANLLERMRK